MSTIRAVRRERRLAGTTWLLLAAAGMLGAYVYVVEVRGGGARDRATEAAARLLPFPASAATEFSLETGGVPIVCRKVAGHWRVVAPITAPGDDLTIEKEIGDLGDARVQRTITAARTGLGEYGLTRPTLLTVAAGARRETIEVGKGNPTDEFVYAMRAAATGAEVDVAVVDRKLKNVCDKSLYDLRDKTALDFDPQSVRAITYAANGRLVRLFRCGASAGGDVPGWLVATSGDSLIACTAPQNNQAVSGLRADRGLVERHLELVSSTRAEAFVSDQPANLRRFGLDPPSGEAMFDLDGGRAMTMLIGGRTADGSLTRYFARSSAGGPVFTINENLPGDVQTSPDTWRERHAVDFEKADVAEIRLISPQRSIEIAKQPDTGQWHEAEYLGRVSEAMNLAASARMPGAQQADADRVGDLLGRLATLQASAFAKGASPAAIGLSSPQLKVVLLDKDSKPLASVSFGASHGSQVYATSPHLGGVFLVPASDAGRFRIGLDALASAP